MDMQIAHIAVIFTPLKGATQISLPSRRFGLEAQLPNSLIN